MRNRSVLPARRARKAGLFPLALACVAMIVPLHAFAQCPPPPPTSPLVSGEVGLFFDAAGTMRCAEVNPGVVTALYVVARVAEGGVASFEIPELLGESLPAALTILGGPSLPADSPFDVIPGADACHMAVRSDPQSCPAVQGELVVLAVVDVMISEPIGGTVCFQTACPTFIGVSPKNPFYWRCDDGSVAQFVGGDSMCIGFGEQPVPVHPSSWGRIKSLYAGQKGR